MTHHNIDDMVYDMTRARAQAVSDVQAENEERRRRQRVEEENRAAYDAAREAERNRRGGAVSSMNQWGPDGGAASSFSNTAIGPDGSVQREGFGDAWGLQARVGSEFADLARRSAMAQRHNAQIGTDSLSAAMRAAMANGGRLPQNLVGMLSRNLGLDGKSASVFSAGYLNNGDFDIDIVTRGANGGLQRTTKKISPREQLGIVNSTPGVWGNDGIAVSQRLYDGLRNTMGKSELPPQGVYAENLRAYNTKKQSADTMKMMMTLYQATMKDLSKGGKQPVTTDVIRARMASDLLKDKNIGPQITSVPDLNEDGTQKMTEDPNTGMQVPAMRQADPNNPDDVERVKRNLDMRLNLVPELAPRRDAQGDAGMNNRLAFLKYIYDRENPPTPPDVLAFQQRQRERQMREVEAAQAREDVTRRPQQVINYFKDGRWYSGNGYVRDGKVYDGQGYEIEGAAPAEMARGADGGVYSNERGWVARALPSARELVGGRGGEEAQGGGAQGGGVNWTPGHDLRNDGKTYKGTGWLGVLRLPNGGVASEYTVGVEIGGKEIDIPTLVPTLTKEEQDLMVNDIIPNNKDIPDSIMKKAVDFAKMRLANGRSVFANDGTPQQTQQPAQGAQGAQGAQQPAEAQGAQSSAQAQSREAAVAEAKARRAAILEERLRRERERGGLPKGASPNDMLPDFMTRSPVGPTLENERRAENAEIDAENAAKERELSYVKHINSFGGRVERDQYGNQVVHISKYEYLPDDLKRKYPDGVLTGVPLDVADEIQRQAEMGFREHAKAEGAKKENAKAEVEAAAKKLRSDLLKRFPTDSEARDREYKRGLHAIRMEKDERYRRNYEYQKKLEREESDQRTSEQLFL